MITSIFQTNQNKNLNKNNQDLDIFQESQTESNGIIRRNDDKNPYLVVVDGEKQYNSNTVKWLKEKQEKHLQVMAEKWGWE